MDVRKLFRPLHLLLYFLAIADFFVLGAWITGLSGAADGQGLAGGAIVFMYGVFTAIAALVLSMFVAYRAKPSLIKTITLVLGVLFVILALLVIYRMNVIGS